MHLSHVFLDLFQAMGGTLHEAAAMTVANIARTKEGRSACLEVTSGFLWRGRASPLPRAESPRLTLT